MSKEKEKEINSEEDNEMLESLFNGEEVFEYVSTKRGKFKIKYPTPKMLRQIQIVLSNRYPGIDLNTLPQKTRNSSELYAMLDVIVVEGPKWWDKFESAEDCPDDALIMELYRGYLRFYNEVQKKVGRFYPENRNSAKKLPVDNEEKDVDSGAFSDIANG